MIAQTHIRISRSDLLGPFRHIGPASLELMGERRTFLRVVGVLVGIAAGSSSTLAEVEESVSQDGARSGYSDSSTTQTLLINVLGNDFGGTTNQPAEDVVFSINPRSVADLIRYNARDTTAGLSDNPSRFGDVFIPDAVWTLEGSTQVGLDHISGEFGSEFGTTLGGRQKSADFWTRAIFSPWGDKNDDKESDISQLLPLQVASCGGSSVEHSDLEFCDISDGIGKKKPLDNSIAPEASSSIAMTNAPNVNLSVISSNASSTSTSEGNAVEIPPSSSIIPNASSNGAPQSSLIDISVLSSQCEDTPTPCMTIAINPMVAPTNSPATPMESPTTPTDSPATPTDFPITTIDPLTPSEPTPPTPPVVSIGDPESVLSPPPVSPPPLAASPIPETSTWIMTLIGFAAVAFGSRARAMRVVHHGVVGTFRKLI
jgi:hypothetical protein